MDRRFTKSTFILCVRSQKLFWREKKKNELRKHNSDEMREEKKVWTRGSQREWNKLTTTITTITNQIHSNKPLNILPYLFDVFFSFVLVVVVSLLFIWIWSHHIYSINSFEGETDLKIYTTISACTDYSFQSSSFFFFSLWLLFVEASSIFSCKRNYVCVCVCLLHLNLLYFYGRYLTTVVQTKAHT